MHTDAVIVAIGDVSRYVQRTAPGLIDWQAELLYLLATSVEGYRAQKPSRVQHQQHPTQADTYLDGSVCPCCAKAGTCTTRWCVTEQAELP